MLLPDRAKSRIFFWFVSLQVAALLLSAAFSLALLKRYYYVELDIDIFGDFRNLLGVLYAFPNPYDTGVEGASVSYPPFALLFYLPYLLLYYIFGPADWVQCLSLLLFLGAPFSAIIFIFYKLFEKRSLTLLLPVFLTFPFVFLICRANVLIYCFLFILLFLLWYKSEEKIKRELALLALAAASAIKLYPLAFLLLLLLERRIRDTAKCALCFLALFFLPFIFFKGGFYNVILFAENMRYFTDSTVKLSAIKCDNYSLITLIQTISYVFSGSIPAQAVSTTNLLASAFLLLSLAVFSFALEERWKVLALLALAVTLIPSVSYIYTQVFFIPAFICFLCSGKLKKMDILYLALFLLILMPPNRLFLGYDPATKIPINYPWYYNNPEAEFAIGWTPIESPVNAFIMMFSMLALYILLAADAAAAFVKKVRAEGFASAVKSAFLRKSG